MVSFPFLFCTLPRAIKREKCKRGPFLPDDDGRRSPEECSKLSGHPPELVAREAACGHGHPFQASAQHHPPLKRGEGAGSTMTLGGATPFGRRKEIALSKRLKWKDLRCCAQGGLSIPRWVPGIAARQVCASG